MKKIGIFYFSGTGNTEIVARLLAEAYRRRHIDVACIRMEAVVNQQTPLALNDFDLIGVGHPVLGFGASGIAERFVRMLPEGLGKPAFVFKTASSPHYVNHGASDVIIRAMAKKGYRVFHNSIIAMPCNFFMKYDDRLNKQLYRAAVKKVEIIAAQTAAGQEHRHGDVSFVMQSECRLLKRSRIGQTDCFFAANLIRLRQKMMRFEKES